MTDAAQDAPAEGHTPDEIPVHIAWNRVMADVRAIDKAGRNEFQKFNFRGIDQVMNAVGPIFRKHGVFVLPTGVDAKHRDFTSGNKGTLQHEAILTVTYRIWGPKGDSMEAESIGESADSSDKATTQAMSVAYRTLLLQGLTMPTDDKDPDENTVDRSDVDEAAKKLGWDTAAEQQAGWALMMGVDNSTHPDVVAWGKAVKLAPSTLTPNMAAEWAIRVANVGKRLEVEEQIAAPTPTPPNPQSTPPYAEPESDRAPSPTLERSRQDPPAFDAAGAWAMLHQLHNNVPDGARFSEIQSWLEAEGINETTITKAQAAEYHDRITKSGVKPENLPAPERLTLKDSGWRSQKEKDSTWTSLLARQESMLDEDASEVIGLVKEQFGGLDPVSFTKDQATVWLKLIDEHEQPF